MQFKFVAILATLAAASTSVAAVDGIFWCNAQKGAGTCALPGVGPTYDCGKANGGTGYNSGSNQKYWTHLGNYAGFVDCCHKAGRGACRD
jgi:hypothetical protein